MNNYSLVASAVLLSICAACSSGDQQAETTIHSVLVVKPTATGATVSKNYSGVVTESKTISLGFKTAGQISKTYVKQGDYVKQGQLIATLDDSDYRLAANDAQVQFDQMSSEMERLEYLFQTNNLAQNDYEKSIAGYKRLKINLENSLNKLKYCKLYAPVSGYVTKLNFEKAEMVNAGTPVIELMDNSALEIAVDLPTEAYLRRDKFCGYTAQLSDGSQFALTLLSITPKADNNQLYSMRLAVPANAKSKVTPGMNVDIIVDRSDNTDDSTETTKLSVPIRSIFYDGEQHPCVWVLDADSTVKATTVTLSDNLGNGYVTVTSGLTGNETIVKAGVNSLQPGEKVKVIDEPQLTNVGKLL
jgi:RND family efflux transporter MFP subunit